MSHSASTDPSDWLRRSDAGRVNLISPDPALGKSWLADVPITLPVEDVEALLCLICGAVDDLDAEEIRLLERLAIRTRDPLVWAEELDDKRRYAARDRANA